MASSATPVRHALRDDSALKPKVENGLGAVESSHRAYFEDAVRSAFADSLDIDDGLKEGKEHENRWDYLLGHAATCELIAVEPHSAKEDEIGTVIRKRNAAREQLRSHLRDGAKIHKWLWVASGKVHFAKTEKAKVRLDQNGIEFVGTRILAKHLPSMTSPSAEAKAKSRRKAGP